MQRFGGISRYHYKLLEKLRNLNINDKYEIVNKWTNNYYFNGKKTYFNFKGNNYLTNKLNQFIVSKKIKKADIFHPTYYDTYFLNFKQSTPFVITIHDMIPEQQNLFKHSVLIDQKKRLIEKASAVIAISETTKNDIIRFTGIDSSKIFVIYHGKPDYFINSTLRRNSKVQNDYLLYVGLRGWYKNFKFILRTLRDYLLKNQILLKVAGREASIDEIKFIKSLGLEDKVLFFSDLNDASLFELYNNALCFIYPSLMEGFGIPILEAFYAECPVLCSDIPTFREVAADGAYYFDPLVPESLLYYVDKICTDISYRKTIIDKGLERLKIFSWEKAAFETALVYKNVIDN